MALVLPDSWTGPIGQPTALNSAGIGAGLQIVLAGCQGAGPVDLATGQLFTLQGSAVTSSAPTGWTMATGTTDGLQSSSTGVGRFGVPLTFGIVFVPVTLSASANIINSARGATANNTNRFGLRVGSGGSALEIYSQNNGGTTVTAATPNAIQVGQVNVAVGVFRSSSSRQCWLNGQASSLDTTSNVPIVTSPTTCIGSAVGTTRQNGQGMTVMLAVAWNRALDQNEALAFCANPWQIFNPPTRRPWLTLLGDSTVALTGVSATASPGTVVAGNTQAPTGNSATSAVGTVTVSSAPALTAVSATASAGTVTASGGQPAVSTNLPGGGGQVYKGLEVPRKKKKKPTVKKVTSFEDLQNLLNPEPEPEEEPEEIIVPAKPPQLKLVPKTAPPPVPEFQPVVLNSANEIAELRAMVTDAIAEMKAATDKAIADLKAAEKEMVDENRVNWLTIIALSV